MTKTIFKKKSVIRKLFVVCLLSFLALTSANSNVYATTSSNTVAENTEVQSYPNPVYITERVIMSKSYAIPPATRKVTKKINGFLYSGTLNRFDYQDAVDHWIVNYKGYVYAD